MDQIISITLSELSSIIGLTFKSIFNDLIFPTGPQTVEELVSSKIRGQNSMIRSQQDQMVYQTGVVQDLNRQIRDLKDLVDQKDKENERLNKLVKSLEF